MRSRYRFLVVLGLFFLCVTNLLRVVLWLQTGDLDAQGAGLGLTDLLLSMALGLPYDLGVFLYMGLPFALLLGVLPEGVYQGRIWKMIEQGAGFLFIALTWFIAAAELVFWQEFQVRFNFIAVDYLVYRREVVGNIWQSYPLVWMLLSVFGLSVLSFLLLRHRLQPVSRQGFIDQPRSGNRMAFLTVYVALTWLVYLTLDQSLREEISRPQLRELASNGAYQFFSAFRNNELDYAQLYSQEDPLAAAALLRAQLSNAPSVFIDSDPVSVLRWVQNPPLKQPYNLVLITVESLSARFLSYFTPRLDITPNLDRLIGESLFFDRFYATGTRTTRGLEAITLSIPPTPGRSIVKRLGREKNWWALGQVLKEKGYDVQFLYGGRGYFDNMSAFFEGNGYRVVDQTSVPDEELTFQNIWGMSDEDLYRRVLKSADTAAGQKQPFFLHAMTTSNHRPNTYPEGRIDIPSGSGRRGAVKYTDYALGQFLNKAADRPWFDTTLFVILADHCANSAGKEDLPLERYHIPMWIYAPKMIEPGVYNAVASQIDVAPTLLGLMGISYVSGAFGQNLLRESPPGRALIGNYQYLGYYRPEVLTLLKPGRKNERYDYSVSPPWRISPVPEDSDLRMTRAYYQQANQVFRHRLNDWSRVQKLEASITRHSVAGVDAGE